MAHFSHSDPLPDPMLDDAAIDTEQLEQQLRRAFAPLDSRAFGLAIGIVTAVGLSALTILSRIVDPGQEFPLRLLGEYFVGYSVSFTGLLAGAVWAFVTGFVGGWLMCAVRNLVLAIWLLKARVRADLDASQDVLDHI